MFSRLAFVVSGIIFLGMPGFDSATQAGWDHARKALVQQGHSSGKRPYNIIFVICDQESYHVRGGKDFVLPARQALQRRGVTFRNHYIGSAVCTPSRALFFTG
ncbi:MAG: sulfatase-like hydrolase/transferase [Planctomycetes bacterium]|nr:sulfatase-like hydrolase/transferase [Planctomycetota bacterium]